MMEFAGTDNIGLIIVFFFVYRSADMLIFMSLQLDPDGGFR